MRKKDVKIGGTYIARISGNLAPVRLDRESRFEGWEATNLVTGRSIRIKSAQKLREEVRS